MIANAFRIRSIITLSQPVTITHLALVYVLFVPLIRSGQVFDVDGGHTVLHRLPYDRDADTGFLSSSTDNHDIVSAVISRQAVIGKRNTKRPEVSCSTSTGAEGG